MSRHLFGSTLIALLSAIGPTQKAHRQTIEESQYQQHSLLQYRYCPLTCHLYHSHYLVQSQLRFTDAYPLLALLLFFSAESYSEA
jgi:hypothetical protein